jgi:hypothetical protein
MGRALRVCLTILLAPVWLAVGLWVRLKARRQFVAPAIPGEGPIVEIGPRGIYRRQPNPDEQAAFIRTAFGEAGTFAPTPGIAAELEVKRAQRLRAMLREH